MMQLDPSTSSLSEQPPQVDYMDSALYKAAQDGDIEPFNQYQGDLSCLVDGRKNTALHIYCRTGVLQAYRNEREFLFVQQLVDKCSSLLLQPNDRGGIPLHIAAMHGHSDIVKFLIELAKEVQQEDLEKGSEATTLRQMLRMRDKDGNTAMHKAVESGELAVVLLLLENLDADFSFSANTSGVTPLYMAVMAKRGELMDKILEIYKASDYSTINYYGGPNGRTALHAAVEVWDEETMRKLINANEHLTKQIDANGWTPLHYVVPCCSTSVAKMLLERDASAAYITDKPRGMTALHLAAWQGDAAMMKDIISYCPGCCEIVDNRGWNFLHFTVLNLEPEELERFLMDNETGINRLPIRNLVNEKDVNGITPFDLLMSQARRRGDDRQVVERFRQHKSKEYESGYMYSVTKETQIRELLKEMANDKEALPLFYHLRTIEEKVEEEKEHKDIEEKARQSHLVVAALVATVTFAAAFTVPGGYNEQQRTATLIRDSVFKAFIISNSLAFVFSLLAITFHFASVMFHHGYLRTYVTPSWIRRADWLTVFAMAAMVVAFSTRFYAVLQSLPLQPSSVFTITALLFGLVFIPICVALLPPDVFYSLGLDRIKAWFIRFIRFWVKKAIRDCCSRLFSELRGFVCI